MKKYLVININENMNEPTLHWTTKEKSKRKSLKSIGYCIVMDADIL